MVVALPLFCTILLDVNDNFHFYASSTEKDLIYEQELDRLCRSSGYDKELYGPQR